VDDFAEAVTAWRMLPFPDGGTSDATGELHADLALADTWVAESVLPYVEHGTHDPAKVDVIDTLGDLQRRAVNLARSSDSEERELADAYLGYIEALVRVYEGFLRRS
jgi:hypothetical protein